MRAISHLKLLHDPILRVCLLVMGASIVVLGLIFAISNQSASKQILESSIRLAQLNVEKAKGVVERQLTAIETTAFNLSSTRIRRYREANQIYDLMERFVNSNPVIWGIAIGYEPGVIPGHEEGFAPYVRRVEGVTERLNLLEMGRTYLQSEWYVTPMRQKEPFWCKPFRDVKNALIACFCIPLTDEQERPIGVIAVDMLLDQFTEQLVKEIQPYEHSDCMVLDKDLDFIAHPDHSLIMTSLADAVSKITQENGCQVNESIAIRMRNRDQGYDTYSEHTRFEGMMFYAPIRQTEWTVALSILKSDIFKESRKLARSMFYLCLAGVFLMVCASGFLFNKIRKVVEHKAGIERELSMAHNIQMAMVKKVFPAYPDRDDIDVYATLIPAKDVGGDLFDFALKGEVLHFCIGDVSGKGVPASLFMAITRTLYRSIIAREEAPARIAEALNQSIAVDNKENMFVTMYIGTLDLKSGKLRLCNCGHNVPLSNGIPANSQRKGEEEIEQMTLTNHMEFMTLPPTNIPIGVMEEFPYEEMTLQIEPGFRLLLYTDGITEAENMDHQLYGEERLREELREVSCKKQSAQLDVEHILNSVHRHANGYTQSDDITMLSIHYK